MTFYATNDAIDALVQLRIAYAGRHTTAISISDVKDLEDALRHANEENEDLEDANQNPCLEVALNAVENPINEAGPERDKLLRKIIANALDSLSDTTERLGAIEDALEDREWGTTTDVEREAIERIAEFCKNELEGFEERKAERIRYADEQVKRLDEKRRFDEASVLIERAFTLGVVKLLKSNNYSFRYEPRAAFHGEKQTVHIPRWEAGRTIAKDEQLRDALITACESAGRASP